MIDFLGSDKDRKIKKAAHMSSLNYQFRIMIYFNLLA